MVFVPVRRGDVGLLRTGTTTASGWVGHAATPPLMASHGFDGSMAEDGEFAALCYAGVHALTLTADALRLVLAAEVPENKVTIDAGDPFGQVRCAELSWSRVTALFADEASSAAGVAAARAAGSGMPLEEALQQEPVQRLLEEHDLLWFAPEELDRLPD